MCFLVFIVTHPLCLRHNFFFGHGGHKGYTKDTKWNTGFFRLIFTLVCLVVLSDLGDLSIVPEAQSNDVEPVSLSTSSWQTGTRKIGLVLSSPNSSIININ